jgi:hypothetical protein
VKKLMAALLGTLFLFGFAYACGLHLYEWYNTGLLPVHRKMPVGPDSVSYNSDPCRPNR